MHAARVSANGIDCSTAAFLRESGAVPRTLFLGDTFSFFHCEEIMWDWRHACLEGNRVVEFEYEIHKFVPAGSVIIIMGNFVLLREDAGCNIPCVS